jgi:5-methylthioadenosine/S-adenosylhomocysteine deaminase
MRSMMNLQRLVVNQMVPNGNNPPNPVDLGLPPDQPQWPGTGGPPKPAAVPLTTRDVLRYAAINGAKALRLGGKTGSLTPGKEADIIILDATRIYVFPVNQVPGAVVSLMDRTNVETVIVAGKVRKWRGALLDADLPKLRRDLEKVATTSSRMRSTSPAPCSAAAPSKVSLASAFLDIEVMLTAFLFRILPPGETAAAAPK